MSTDHSCGQTWPVGHTFWPSEGESVSDLQSHAVHKEDVKRNLANLKRSVTRDAGQLKKLYKQVEVCTTFDHLGPVFESIDRIQKGVMSTWSDIKETERSLASLNSAEAAVFALNALKTTGTAWSVLPSGTEPTFPSSVGDEKLDFVVFEAMMVHGFDIQFDTLDAEIQSASSVVSVGGNEYNTLEGNTAIQQHVVQVPLISSVVDQIIDQMGGVFEAQHNGLTKSACYSSLFVDPNVIDPKYIESIGLGQMRQDGPITRAHGFVVVDVFKARLSQRQ